MTEECYSSDIKYFTPLLTTLFNTIFDSADYPKDWAQGLIYPVHKKGDKSDAQNYGKVSLIPFLSKVFESVLLLENRLSYKNLVCCDDPLQRGFKKDCRTSDKLFVLYNLVETQKSRKKTLYVCYIDLTKAFQIELFYKSLVSNDSLYFLEFYIYISFLLLLE